MAEKGRLSKLSGEEFDREYMNCMVKEHSKKKEASRAKDPDVQASPSKTLPKLEEPLQLAKQIAPKERREARHAKKQGSKGE